MQRPRFFGRPAPRDLFIACVGLLVMIGSLMPLGGCTTEQTGPAAAVAPPPTYTGPRFMRGTVGSLVSLENYEPLLVSGYGVVVLKQPTGSSTVPSYLRQRLINEMRKNGVGSAALGWQNWSPARMLSDPRTAVVAVQGFIPPGATPGTRFDVLVSALPQTQTTSLAGGTLWTVDLSIEGTNTEGNFTQTIAKARGPIYLNPFDADELSARQQRKQLRQAMVVAGGSTLVPPQIQLFLNQPSFRRARLIADRINERFSFPADKLLVAQAQDDQTIVINIPKRWQGRTEELLLLISSLYIERGEGFEMRRANDLAEVLREQPQFVEEVTDCWKALGKQAIPVLQELYDDQSLTVRMSAMDAGAFLGDGRAARYLYELSLYPDPLIRKRVGEALVAMPSNFTAIRTLRDLLDDPDRTVRVAAYESLALTNSSTIDRFDVRDDQNEIKFIIDRVPSNNPMVLITQEGGIPRIAIFGEQLGFEPPMFTKLWDRRLLLKLVGDNQPLELYYQSPKDVTGKTYKLNPTVATLAYMLAHEPTLDRPQDGLKLTYGEVVDAIYQLALDGHIPAPVELQSSKLAQLVAEYEELPDAGSRPEFSADPLQPASLSDEAVGDTANDSP